MKSTLLQKIIVGIVLVFFIALVTISVKACNVLVNEVEQKGLKHIIEEIWEGNNHETR